MYIYICESLYILSINLYTYLHLFFVSNSLWLLTNQSPSITLSPSLHLKKNKKSDERPLEFGSAPSYFLQAFFLPAVAPCLLWTFQLVFS